MQNVKKLLGFAGSQQWVEDVFRKHPELCQLIKDRNRFSSVFQTSKSILGTDLTVFERLCLLQKNPDLDAEGYADNLIATSNLFIKVPDMCVWLVEKLDSFLACCESRISTSHSSRILGLKACLRGSMNTINPFKFAKPAYEACLATEKLDLKSIDLDLWIKVRLCQSTALLWQPRAEFSKILQGSIDISNELLGLLDKKKNISQIRMAHNNLGVAFSRIPFGNRTLNIEKSIKHYEIALGLAREENVLDAIATTQNNLGLMYRQRIAGDKAENLEKSIDYLMKALRDHRQAERPLKIAQTLTNLGVSHCERIIGDRTGNLFKAVEYYRDALDLMDKEKHAGFRSWTFHNLGASYYLLFLNNDRSEYIEKSRRCFQRALKFRKKEHSTLDWLLTTRNLSRVYSIRKRGNRSTNCQIAHSYLDGTLEAIPRHSHRVEWANTHVYTGQVYWLQSEGEQKDKLLKAAEHFGQALEVFKPDILPVETREAAMGQARVMICLKRYENAIEALRIAISADKHRYRQMFISQARAKEINSGANAYYLMAHALAQQGKHLEALEWLERGKSRLLKETLRFDRAKFQSLPDNLRKEYITLSEKLRALQIEHYIPSRDIQEIIKDTRNTRDRLNCVIDQGRKLAPGFFTENQSYLEQLKTILNQRIIVQFNVTEMGTDTFVARMEDDKVIVKHQFNKNFNAGILKRFTRNWINKMHSILAEPSPAKGLLWGCYVKRKMRHLSREIVGFPMENLLESKGKKLVIIPHLSLHLLPLHMLTVFNNKRYVYLMDMFSVSTIPSISIVPISTESDRKREFSYAGISNPTGDLFWADREIKETSQIFNAYPSVVLSGLEAEPRAVKKAIEKANVVHFACHARFDSVEPYKSFLALSTGGQSEAGEVQYRVIQHTVKTQPLFLADVFSNLRFSQDSLIVLSCCDSGLSQIAESADEFISFATAFFGSGAGAVVSSLWQVDDRAGCALMRRFYENIVERGFSFDLALKDAQLSLRSQKEFRNPFYWGAFNYNGL